MASKQVVAVAPVAAAPAGMQVGYVNIPVGSNDALMAAFAARAWQPNAAANTYTTAQCQGCQALYIGTVAGSHEYQLVGKFATTWARMVANAANAAAANTVAHTGRVRLPKQVAAAVAPAKPAKASKPAKGSTAKAAAAVSHPAKVAPPAPSATLPPAAVTSTPESRAAAAVAKAAAKAAALGVSTGE